MIHSAANEGALLHYSERLRVAELELAVAKGNLRWKDVLLAERDCLIAQLEEQLPPKLTRPPGAPIGAPAIRAELERQAARAALEQQAD